MRAEQYTRGRYTLWGYGKTWDPVYGRIPIHHENTGWIPLPATLLIVMRHKDRITASIKIKDFSRDARLKISERKKQEAYDPPLC